MAAGSPYYKKRYDDRYKHEYTSGTKSKAYVLWILTQVCILAGRAQAKCTCGACSELDNIFDLVIDVE